MTQKNMKLVDKYQFNVNKFNTSDGVDEFDAVHIDTKHNYTIRRLGLTNGPEGKQYHQMLNQLAILKKLNNPLVPKCHKLFRTSNNMYHIYDRISGETLQAYLRRDFTEPNWKNKMKSVLTMAEQLCSVLVYLTERRICHSQINLQNILVENQSVSKIINFSRAKQFQNKQEQLEQQVKNTQLNEYSSPEIKSGKLTLKSDIYSIGVVLQKMFIKLKGSIRGFAHTERQLASIDKIVSFCNNKIKNADLAQRINAKQVLAFFKDKQFEDSREDVIAQRSRLLMTDPGVKVNHHQQQNISKQKSLTPFKLKNPQVSDVGSETHDFFYIARKVLHKRSLSNLLLELSDFCLSLAQSSSKRSLPLSFLLMKKSTLIMSQLAKFLDTGRGEGMKMDEKTREKLKRHKMFANLENIIHGEKKHLQQKFIDAVYELREILPTDESEELKAQLQSEAVNQQYFQKCLANFQSQIYFWSQIEGEKTDKQMKFGGLLNKRQLIFLFILSLLNEFATIGEMFDELFGQRSCSLQKQPFFMQMMEMEDAQIQSLILQQGRVIIPKENAAFGSLRSISASRRL